MTFGDSRIVESMVGIAMIAYILSISDTIKFKETTVLIIISDV